MVLGLTPEAYVVYYINVEGETYPRIAHISNAALFFTAYNDAKNAAEDFLEHLALIGDPTPVYTWIAPIYKLWVNGED